MREAGKVQHINIDIIGPLNTSPEGFRYCVTMIDRCTHWPEAIPVKDIFAETIAKAVYEGWITRFGCPSRLSSDQGRQFESNLFAQLLKLFGIKRIRSSPYHPQSNGVIERWHRSLKTSLMARLINSSSWISELSTVLLGLRTAVREDTSFSAAELIYEKKIRLPGDFYVESRKSVSEEDTYVEKIRNAIKNFKSLAANKNTKRSVFVHPDLLTCEHVFIRNDAVRKPLIPPYSGPYRILSRHNKVYRIQLPNREISVSIDRLKPAYILKHSETETGNTSTTSCSQPSTGNKAEVNLKASPSDNISKANCNNQTLKTTRSGRNVKPPVRFLC